jgi:hypothetical protein
LFLNLFNSTKFLDSTRFEVYGRDDGGGILILYKGFSTSFDVYTYNFFYSANLFIIFEFDFLISLNVIGDFPVGVLILDLDGDLIINYLISVILLGLPTLFVFILYF